MLAGLTLHRGTRGLTTIIAQDTLRNDVSRNLWRIGFLELLGHHKCLAPGNSLPLHRQDEHDVERLVAYLAREVMSRSAMPSMSPALSKEIRRSFVEIFGNVFYHSESPIGGLVCGQVYPRRQEIEVSFFDSGVGLCAKVRSVMQGIADDPTAIRWALERGNSTLSISEGDPRGLGLFWLREFLKVNGGDIQISANQGHYRERGSAYSHSSLLAPLRGTLIDLRIKVRAGVSYKFANE